MCGGEKYFASTRVESGCRIRIAFTWRGLALALFYAAAPPAGQGGVVYIGGGGDERKRGRD